MGTVTRETKWHFLLLPWDSSAESYCRAADVFSAERYAALWALCKAAASAASLPNAE